MKKVFLSAAFLAAALTPAIAADVVELPVASTYNWTGLYLGAHVGGGSSKVDWEYTVGGTADHDGSGALGGVQAGYNFQSGNIVYGIEADISAAHIDGGTACPNPTFSCDSDVKMLGSLRGRIGYAMDRLLIYGTGGLGFGRVEISTSGPIGTNGTSKTRAGWTLGAGLEYAFTDHWSLKGEYKYFDLGKGDYTVDTGLNVEAKVRIHTGVIGLNYKF
ncbi:outer membrane protein [Mesorhizobium sp. M0859]|uniref:outer membrane protein n=1 Tax=Mesorhizobium sp. M0859 TaxID=2957014 RepID=UPI00333D80A3